jgi:hypothetical protein
VSELMNMAEYQVVINAGIVAVRRCSSRWVDTTSVFRSEPERDADVRERSATFG